MEMKENESRKSKSIFDEIEKNIEGCTDGWRLSESIFKKKSFLFCN